MFELSNVKKYVYCPASIFDLENIMKMDECNLEDAKKQMLELIKQSGIRCTDAALKKLEI